ncbi:hypothetical protein A3195_16995 [Candidatus Thiodiazotropha endoloripes]|uniref:Uncharacterized protein n=3 Tax=Candidatus Thiodiazotropha endoloripes TaxID=1818881 RepID=A0A1E2UPV4_9GAMM|nr:hypothetical protein A3195_16995 [Candidatus Thiodiazotropha endoloripes]ODB87719.1 hypothetical protein A3193_02105 [Candidatus Thiodiazotropha endoloripes]ODB96796.1 hypothetical protein A3196_08530 [Candidatus Thiodiazotropha endoloripes]
MNEVMMITAVAVVIGLIWGYRKPAGYCRMSTVEQQGLSNRIWSGLINGAVLGGIALVVATILLG